LDIVLTAEEYIFYTNEPKSGQPAEDALESENEYYKQWVKTGEMLRCYRLAAMSGVFAASASGYAHSFRNAL
jgi:hypothetical protein